MLKIKKSPYNKHKLELVLPWFIFTIISSIYAYFVYASYIQLADSYETTSRQIAQISEEYSKQSFIEAKKKEPVFINLPGAAQIRAIVEDYNTPASLWTLVNKSNQIPENYVPSSLVIPNVAVRSDKSALERSVRGDVAAPLEEMFNAAATDGYKLLVGSGYRSVAQQSIYFNNLVASVGFDKANQSIAVPGQSEHHTGLAMDISTVSRTCYLDNCFADTSDGQWLANNSYKYGFILRYPKDKEAITGYRYEPWHFRYVGKDLATALHESGLTLDESWSYLQTALATLKSNGAI